MTFTRCLAGTLTTSPLPAHPLDGTTPVLLPLNRTARRVERPWPPIRPVPAFVAGNHE